MPRNMHVRHLRRQSIPLGRQIWENWLVQLGINATRKQEVDVGEQTIRVFSSNVQKLGIRFYLLDKDGKNGAIREAVTYQ